jgi:hypothetical protein
MLAIRNTVGPGERGRWLFRPPPGFEGGQGASLRFRLLPSARGAAPVSGLWSVSAPAGADAPAFASDRYPPGSHEIRIPAGALPSSGPFGVSFRNQAAETSNPAVFDPETPVELLVRAGTFEANLMRCLVIRFCQLGLLAALGLTAGTLFSFPVAAFSASSAVVAVLLSHYLFSGSLPERKAQRQHSHGHEAEPSVLVETMERVVLAGRFVYEPILRFDPVRAVTDGIRVSWGATGRALLVLAALYPALLASLGAWALDRRELALGGRMPEE